MAHSHHHGNQNREGIASSTASDQSTTVSLIVLRVDIMQGIPTRCQS